MEKWLKSKIAAIKQNYLKKKRREMVQESKHIIRLIKEDASAAIMYIRNGNINPRRIINEQGQTLLHIAVELGNYELTCFALDIYLDINAQDDEGQTPLMIAVKNKDNRLIPILMNSDVDIYICDNFGKSALQIVCEMGASDSQIIVQFLNRVRVDCRSDYAKIALILISAGCPLSHVIYLHDPDIIRGMLENGCPVNAVDPETGQTALHVAFEYTSSASIRLLLEHGANIDSADFKGRLPYFSCGMWGESDKDLEITGIILKKSMLLTTSDESGIIQIGNLLKNGKYGTILVILRSDLDLSAKDSHGRTLLHYLALNPTLAEHQQFKEELQVKKFNPNACDTYGNSILINATMLGNLMLMELLLELGANPDTANNQNHTPLLVSMFPPPNAPKRNCDPEKCVELLLLYRADLEKVLDGFESMMATYLELNQNFAVDLWKRTLSPPIIKQLAILVANGTPIGVETINNAIESDLILKCRFDVCTQHLDTLKMKYVYGSLTLFQLVSESIEKIAIYSRNIIFRRNLDAFNHNFCPDSFYSNLIRKNVQRAVKIIETREAIAKAICKVTGWSYIALPFIFDKIISYAMS